MAAKKSGREKAFDRKKKETGLSNIGSKWTPEEEQQLIEELGEGNSYDEISEIHGRTVKAIEARINLMIGRNRSKSAKEISKLLNVDQDYIQQRLDEYKSKAKKTSTKSLSKNKKLVIKKKEKPSVKESNTSTLKEKMLKMGRMIDELRDLYDDINSMIAEEEGEE